VRRCLLAGVAFVLAGLALEAGRRRDRRKWLRIRERLANLVRLMTADHLAMRDLRARVFPGYCPVVSAEVNLEGGFYCPAGDKYAAKGGGGGGGTHAGEEA
jgi:hypothetical protein